MSRRHLIPLGLLAVLGVLTAVFAVVGASGAPSAETLTVQNGSTRTFGSPTGAVSFLSDLTNSVGSGTRASTVSQSRLIQYSAPLQQLVVFEVTSRGAQPIEVLHQPHVSCVLSAYTSIVGGSTPWTGSGHGTYTRTESLADYSARVPITGRSTCAPQQSVAHGEVSEKAVVRGGYLVAVGLTASIPPQTLSNGRPTGHVVQGEQLVMIKIGDTSVKSLVS